MTNNKVIKISVFFLLTICLFNLRISAQEGIIYQKIKAVKTVSGKFVRFFVGDFIHIEIKKSNGKFENFFLDGYYLDYFLVANRGKTMTFTYNVVDALRYRKRIVITTMKSAKIGNLTFEKWRKDLRKKYTKEQIEKKYDPLVEKYTEY